MTEALQQALEDDGRPLLALKAASGVDIASISRFKRDERSMLLSRADALVEALGLECRLVRPRKRGK